MSVFCSQTYVIKWFCHGSLDGNLIIYCDVLEEMYMEHIRIHYNVKPVIFAGYIISLTWWTPPENFVKKCAPWCYCSDIVGSCYFLGNIQRCTYFLPSLFMIVSFSFQSRNGRKKCHTSHTYSIQFSISLFTSRCTTYRYIQWIRTRIPSDRHYGHPIRLIVIWPHFHATFLT